MIGDERISKIMKVYTWLEERGYDEERTGEHIVQIRGLKGLASERRPRQIFQDTEDFELGNGKVRKELSPASNCFPILQSHRHRYNSTENSSEGSLLNNFLTKQHRIPGRRNLGREMQYPQIQLVQPLKTLYRVERTSSFFSRQIVISERDWSAPQAAHKLKESNFTGDFPKLFTEKIPPVFLFFVENERWR